MTYKKPELTYEEVLSTRIPLHVDTPTQANAIEPNHYTSMTISPLEYIEANQEAFTWCTANAIKYISRSKKKNGLEDLKKAAWYINHEIERIENQT